MTTNAIPYILPDLIDNLRTIAENGKYREKEELIPVLQDLAWFDKFDEDFFHRRKELLEDLMEEMPEEVEEELEQ